jgi:hypothetical protein
MRVLLATISTLLVLGCQFSGAAPGCTANIDWVNFVEVGATQYVAAPGTPELQETDLGPVYGQVKFRLSGNICDPDYKINDGDSAFLDAGTPIYQVTGFPPGRRLAARFKGRLLAYDATAPG